MKSSEIKDVWDAVQCVVSQLDRPLIDTWSCALHGHVVAPVARLSKVVTTAQQIAEGGSDTSSSSSLNWLPTWS